ncbi:MAG TPA: hypothetical protein DCY88_12335 [Cyanobacteria bacterium UBA11372]|nr:hypothetical protein [Cyanobacteria bacterium UBA11372]
MALLSLKFLLDNNMNVNEEDVLPLAKQYADPNWIAGDWYLNQPPSYRLLFETLFGRLIVTWGFLATSVVGRLLCYALVAGGLVLIGRKMCLNMPFLMLAIGLFIYTSHRQGIAASEWLLGGLEPKTVAYGLVLLAIGLMLAGYYFWMALMLGLATSFHVLVGGWTFVVVLGWLALRWKTRLQGIRHFGSIVLIYLLASAFAIKPVLEQLFAPFPGSSVTPSYIYVFLRLPHHLNPLSWHSNWWLKLAAYLLVLAFSVSLLWRQQQSDQLSAQYTACMELAEFTMLCLVPFMLSLAVAPFDSEGSFLQYYPFRLGDVMLPLNTCLLFACALQQTFKQRERRVLSLVCILLFSGACSIQAVTFQKQLLTLSQFSKVNLESIALCDWVRTHTPTDTVVVSPPVELVKFTWLAERSTIAKFKLLPQTKARILEWYERLSDLSGGFFPGTTKERTKDRRNRMMRALTYGYNHLTTAQADALMTKYRATYFITGIKHKLDLAIAYRNSRYILYSKKTSE